MRPGQVPRWVTCIGLSGRAIATRVRAQQANHDLAPFRRCDDWAVRLLLVTHEACLGHEAGWSHPERPERLGAVIRGIEASGVDIARAEAPRITRDLLLLNHDSAYINSIKKISEEGGGVLDPDTRVGPLSWEAAVRSAGAGPHAVESLRRGGADAAFVVTRPPGHHALADRAMGFCIFNNIAITARSLTAMGERVAILDWDVHHGNGTQDAFYADSDVLYVSIHESGFYPGTGAMHERGSDAARGTTLNIPIPAGADGSVYRWLTRWVIRREIEQFETDWLLVSAGYDAHQDDPLAGMNLEAEDYGVMTRVVASTVAPGRTIFFLEGGYNLVALQRSAQATVRGQAGRSAASPHEDDVGDSTGWDTALEIARSLE